MAAAVSSICSGRLAPTNATASPGWANTQAMTNCATVQPMRPKNQPSASPMDRLSMYGQTGSLWLRKNQKASGTQTTNPPKLDRPCQNCRNLIGLAKYSAGSYIRP